jgi:hypothetical protein
MLKILSAFLFLALAGAAFAQNTPSVTPSDTPSATPSQTPAVTPSETPAVTPSQAPAIPSQPASVGGLGKCENQIGAAKEKCLQDERNRAAGVGASNAPWANGTGAGTTDPRYTPPAGVVR